MYHAPISALPVSSFSFGSAVGRIRIEDPSRIRDAAGRRWFMLSLIAASAYFLLIHFGVSGTRLRAALITRLGAGPYRGAFALASLIGLAWMIYAYRRAPTVPLWGLLLGFRPAAYVLVLIALLFVVIGLATPSPTRVGMESTLSKGPDMARGVVRITRHPFLWGVALWALVHLIVNGDLASLILFSSLLVLALAGTLSIDAKRKRDFGEQWARFASVTSDIPFAAIAAGRNRLAPALVEIGVWRPLAAIVVYAVAFYLHGRLGLPLV
jgi:uncharacterized membrane protein